MTKHPSLVRANLQALVVTGKECDYHLHPRLFSYFFVLFSRFRDFIYRNQTIYSKFGKSVLLMPEKKGISTKPQFLQADTRFDAQLWLSAIPWFPRRHPLFFVRSRQWFCPQATRGAQASLQKSSDQKTH
jgi:hypothetical protein